MPYLALTGAVFSLAPLIGHSVGLDPHALIVTFAVSAGAYAVGTVLAVQFGVHLPARRMLVVYEVCFVIASALAAWAPNGASFAGAFIAQGLITSLMLIAAVPPLVTGWPAGKMPKTAVIMNLCIFGAVAAGPTAGAALLSVHAWRPLFIVVAVLSVGALTFSLLTFEDDAPHEPDAPWDLVAVGLAIAGCGAGFLGAGELEATLRVTAESLGPLVGGAALLVAMVVYEYLRRNPLMPVKRAATSVPASGIFIALAASAAAVATMELVLEALKHGGSPGRTALVFLPEFFGAIVVAGVFGALFRTRFTPLLALCGLLVIAAADGLLLTAVPAAGLQTAIGAGLLGLGVAASVSPALFMVGFSLRSRLLQRVFGMIELLRGVTGFLVAPILLFIAEIIASHSASGIRTALWICLGLAVAGALGGAALYLAGKRSLEPPDLERWQRDDAPAWRSPPIGSSGGSHERRAG